jgi:hypothetical protein
MIMNYTSLDSAIFGLSKHVFGFFSRSKKDWKHTRALQTPEIIITLFLKNQHFRLAGDCKPPIFWYENNQFVELHQFWKCQAMWRKSIERRYVSHGNTPFFVHFFYMYAWFVQSRLLFSRRVYWKCGANKYFRIRIFAWFVAWHSRYNRKNRLNENVRSHLKVFRAKLIQYSIFLVQEGTSFWYLESRHCGCRTA